jgi:hypothetical protein
MRLHFNDFHNNLHIQSSILTPPHYSAINHFPAPFSQDVCNYLNNLVIQKLGSKDDYSIERFSNSYFRTHSFISESSDINYPFPAIFNCNIKTLDQTLDLIRENYTSNKINLDQTYPISVRYTNGKDVFLVERPPFLANVQYNTSRAYNVDQKHDKTVQMWMPWTVMLVYMDPQNSNYNARLYFNDSPLNSLEDLAVPCFHMNMYDDGSLCLNQTSIMLQQYLMENNSFDIHSVYNFLINDYMSGGWNTDLSLNSFDRIKYHSSSLKDIHRVCQDLGDPQRNISPSISPKSGRNSLKKYYTNYINYFASLSLDEVLSLISSVKSEIKNASRSYSYEYAINNFINKNDRDFVSTIFNQTYYGNDLNISEVFPLIIDDSHIDENNTIKHESYSKIYYSLAKYVTSIHQNNLDQYQFYNSHISIFKGLSDNKALFIKDDFTIIPIDENFDYTMIPAFSNIKEVV